MLTEVDGCLCRLAYWFLWSVLYGAIIDTIFGNTVPSGSLGTILFILWIVLGRYVQTKVHPWLK
jgi:hypothetical protein